MLDAAGTTHREGVSMAKGGIMKKLLVFISSLALTFGGSAVAATAVDYTVNQKTLSAFAASATALTASQKAQVKAAVDANPDAEKFICTGIRFATQPMSENIKVRARAKAACAYAKELNPALSTFFQNKPTNARSYAGKVLLTIKSPVGPVAGIELDDYNPAAVSRIAQAKIDEYLESVSANEPVAYQLVAGPSVTDDHKATERARITKSALFWSDIYDFTPKTFIYTGADAEWMVAELNKLGNTFHDNLVMSDYWRKTGECAQSLAVHNSAQPYYINCYRDGYKDGRMSAIAAHEFAHLPITRYFQNQGGNSPNAVPVWMNEGGAELFGIALTDQAKNLGVDFWHRLHINAPGDIKLSTRTSKLSGLLDGIKASENQEFMTLLESQSGLQSPAPYSMGKWASELLIASKGVEGYIEFLKGMNSSTDWRASFEKTYGVSVTEFYGLMVPYLNWLAEKY